MGCQSSQIVQAQTPRKRLSRTQNAIQAKRSSNIVGGCEIIEVNGMIVQEGKGQQKIEDKHVQIKRSSLVENYQFDHIQLEQYQRHQLTLMPTNKLNVNHLKYKQQQQEEYKRGNSMTQSQQDQPSQSNHQSSSSLSNNQQHPQINTRRAQVKYGQRQQDQQEQSKSQQQQQQSYNQFTITVHTINKQQPNNNKEKSSINKNTIKQNRRSSTQRNKIPAIQNINDIKQNYNKDATSSIHTSSKPSSYTSLSVGMPQFNSFRII